MANYLRLTDAEWRLIQPTLPVPKRGPKRPQDRATCAAFLFAQAANVSLESLPIGHFPPAMFLRSTEARWRRDGTLQRLFEVGAPAMQRMAKQFRDRLIELSFDGEMVSGKATETMPRWTHVRQRV
jgi:transposase